MLSSRCLSVGLSKDRHRTPSRRQFRRAEECAKLDPAAERAMAEEGLGADTAGWPEY